MLDVGSKLSAIDRAANNYLESCYLLNRYKFPHKEADNYIKTYVDKRSPAEIYADIVLYLNEQLSPELAQVWSDFLGRDVTETCYYRSGLSFIADDMRRVKKEFGFKNELKINPEAHMPSHLKSDNDQHSKFCKPENDHCSYFGINNLTNNNLTKQNFLASMKNKQNVKLLIDYLLSKDLPHRSRKKLKVLDKINKSKTGLLNANFKKFIFNLTWRYGGVKIQTPRDCKEIYISNFFNKPLQSFVSGYLAKD